MICRSSGTNGQLPHTCISMQLSRSIYSKLPLGIRGGFSHQYEVLVRMIPAHVLCARRTLRQLSILSMPCWDVMTRHLHVSCTA